MACNAVCGVGKGHMQSGEQSDAAGPRRPQPGFDELAECQLQAAVERMSKEWEGRTQRSERETCR
jgi:hypothetical protein